MERFPTAGRFYEGGKISSGPDLEGAVLLSKFGSINKGQPIEGSYAKHGRTTRLGVPQGGVLSPSGLDSEIIVDLIPLLDERNPQSKSFRCFGVNKGPLKQNHEDMCRRWQVIGYTGVRTSLPQYTVWENVSQI